MAPRPNWKGYLKLSLVSCPILLYPASSASERISFRQINKQTGNRLRQQLVDAVTGEVVAGEDKGRGYEVGKEQYIPIEDEEIEALEIESTRTIDIDKFVPRDQIDPRYIDSPYYIAPDGNVGQDAFAVIREAMRGKEMVALARVVISKRERVIMLEAFEKGLRATTLRYPYEVRNEQPYFEDIPDVKVQGEMLKLAEHILESKQGDFDPAEFEDRYETAVTEMLKAKQAGRPMPETKAAEAPSNVVNLMDALRKSVAAERGTAAKPAPKKAGKAAAKGQREMLLPIAGKGRGKEEAKRPARPAARQRKAG
jgi:DNA end-binding protein Ku